jgi:plastocyanin
MSGSRVATIALIVVGLAAATAAASYGVGSGGSDNARRIATLDDCDRRDPGWAAVGGCTKRGNVSFAEFNAELDSPLAAAVVGHQAWRNQPSYLVIRTGQTVRVRNAGGRPHTFTEVAAFGGGKVPNPALNEGLTPAPECAGSTDIAPGGRITVSGLAVGNHRFMCCIHPWMRALIKVKQRDDHDDDD